MKPILPIENILNESSDELYLLNCSCKCLDNLIYKYLSQSFKVYGYVEIYKEFIDYLKRFESADYVLNPFIMDGYNEIKDKFFTREANDYWYKDTFSIVGNILFIFDILDKLYSLKEYLIANESVLDFENDELIDILFVLNEVYVKSRYIN